MRAPILPAVGFYTDANRHWSTQDCLNWLPVRAERPGTRTQYQLRQCPGLRPFVRTTETGVGRGIYNVEGKLLSVVGSNLYQISNAGVAIPRGTIPGVRRVSMAHNQHGNSNQVSIANGSAGYIYDTSATTLTKITDDGFPGAMLTFFVDGYLGYIDPQGIYWGHSDLNDGTSYNALDSYEAEGLPDRIVSGLVSHREVLIFGTDSTEPYVNSPSGDGTAPFQRASNTVIETGCAATFSPVKLGDLVVFLDQNRRVCVLNGYTAVPISTAAIDQAFGECTEAEVKQAWAFGWQDRGHIVYYITVPGRFTFGYDFTHKEWHRRATNGLPHWAVSGVAKWNGKVIAQDSRNGDLYELRWEYARDAGNSELIREYSPGSLNAGRSHICVNRVSLEFGVRDPEEAREFMEQPTGPSISGSAPDGAAGIAYSYTYTVTPGDAPVTRVEVDETELLAGLSWNEATASITGVPTETGTMRITPRAVDSNGLWDEIADQISIAVPLMVSGKTTGSDNKVVTSIDGVTYDSPVYDLPAADAHLIGSDELRYISYSLNSAHYTDDFGASWTAASESFGGTSGKHQGKSAGNGVVLVPGGGGSEPIHKSTDNGASFSDVASSPAVSVIEFRGSTAIAVPYSTNPTVYVSSAPFDVWTAGGTLTGMSPQSGGRPRATNDGETFCIVGGDNGTGSPYAWFTSDGITVTRESVPGVSATMLTCIAVGVVDGEKVWVAGSDSGEIFRKVDGGAWVSAADSIGLWARAAVWNGVRFVMAGADSGSAVIFTSTDGNVWTESEHPLSYHIDDMAVLFQ